MLVFGAWKREARMRLLIWHMDLFVAEPTERGRSKVADATPQPVRASEALVVFAAAQKGDDADPEGVVTRAQSAIAEVATQVGARRLVLHSFAHLFTELAPPKAAKQLLDALETALRADGYQVTQTAFGWFNRLEMRTKGHPLSRVARDV